MKFKTMRKYFLLQAILYLLASFIVKCKIFKEQMRIYFKIGILYFGRI